MEEKRDSHPLISSLKGNNSAKDVFSPTGYRQRQNDRWVALQSSDRPTHEMNIDPPRPAPKSLSTATVTQGTYLKQLNERMDRVIATQAQISFAQYQKDDIR